MLSADTFRGIHNQFQQRGIPVRLVFLLRDPIERIISSQRMKLRKQGRREAATEVASLCKRVHKDQGLRSNYSNVFLDSKRFNPVQNLLRGGIKEKLDPCSRRSVWGNSDR